MDLYLKPSLQFGDSVLVAILIAMNVTEQFSLADVKNRLSQIVDHLEREHGRVVITKHGRPAAVLISIDDLESLEETLEILSNAELLNELRQARRETVEGKGVLLTKDEALELLRKP